MDPEWADLVEKGQREGLHRGLGCRVVGLEGNRGGAGQGAHEHQPAAFGLPHPGQSSCRACLQLW